MSTSSMASSRSFSSRSFQDTLQHTLAGEVRLGGIGLHGGEYCEVRICPAAIDQGIGFQWFSPESGTASLSAPPPPLAAHFEAVQSTVLSTELAQGRYRIRTVEHLLAALAGLGITNATIALTEESTELPLLDGSAQDWVTAIDRVGLVPQEAAIHPLRISQPLTVQSGDTFIVGLPALETRLTYGIDFPVAAIGQQWHTVVLNPQTFRQEIAPARTFGFRQQIEQAQAAGLIKGGSLENALVCDENGWLNPPLRFENEPVRHKLLDLIGDLSLLGTLPIGHIVAYKASHQLHIEFDRQLAALNR